MTNLRFILRKVSIVSIIIILLFICTNCEVNTRKTDLPNFIFILADNMGYGDAGCYGSEIHRTPHIDNMAKEGILLTNYYDTAPVCTPTRSSFMTGSYAQRVDMAISENGVCALQPVSSKGLNPKEITIAEILKERGYATACLGKWHLGDQPEFFPINHGFDFYLGIPYSEDMIKNKIRNWPELPLIKNNMVIEAPVDLTKTTKKYVKEAVNFIAKNKNRPFFLYFAAHQPGSRPVSVVGDQFSGKSANGAYGDAIEELDWSVGEILKALEEHGISENTMIVFSSDNGAIAPRSNSSGFGINEPFSGGCYSTKEGGMRVPCIVSWPGQIPENSSNEELCTIMDWLPTFAKLADTKVPDDRIIDGKNIWSLLSGDKKNAKTPYRFFYYYNMEQLQAVREGKWKLLLPLENKYDGALNYNKYGNSELKLVDLSKDFKEEKDLSEQYPEIVERLLHQAEIITEKLGDTNKKGKELRPALYITDPVPLEIK